MNSLKVLVVFCFVFCFLFVCCCFLFCFFCAELLPVIFNSWIAKGLSEFAKSSGRFLFCFLFLVCLLLFFVLFFLCRTVTGYI